MRQTDTKMGCGVSTGASTANPLVKKTPPPTPLRCEGALRTLLSDALGTPKALSHPRILSRRTTFR